MTVSALHCWSESDQKAIREQLVRIINSGPFHQSRRRQRFLEYIVNETLAGRGERLKGYNLALEVFDRPRRSTPWSTPSCASRRHACARSCTNTTTPTAETIPSASNCPKAAMRRTSSSGRRKLRAKHDLISSGAYSWSSVRAPHTQALSRADFGAGFDAGRSRRVALPQPLDADPGHGASGTQRPSDRGTPLRQLERRPKTGVLQRRLDRGHHDRPVAGAATCAC